MVDRVVFGGNSSQSAVCVDTRPLVWEYIKATPLLIAVEAKSIKVLSVLIDAGADINHTVRRKEYRLSDNREHFLSGGEVMGLYGDFLNEAEFRSSDDGWTPYKHALLLDVQEILRILDKE